MLLIAKPLIATMTGKSSTSLSYVFYGECYGVFIPFNAMEWMWADITEL